MTAGEVVAAEYLYGTATVEDDRGGTHEAFIAARAQYELAQRRAATPAATPDGGNDAR